MKFTDAEKEVIFLKAITELIDSIINYEVLDLLGKDPHSEICFRTMTHQKYFNIILLDFLSCSDEKVLGEKRSYLEAVRAICQSPNFNKNNSIKNLIIPTQEFIDWLEQEVQVEKIWLPSINIETTLSIKRIEFIKICGNRSKHNFSRLSGVANKLIGIFKKNAINISFEDALLILDDFYKKFHFDILNYHSSTIAEFFNSIRWGIYEYLQPELYRSIVYEDNKHPKKYHCTHPTEINNNFARNCYWNLMNKVQSKPYMRKFRVTRYLKMRY
ncbi:hypothetical protein CVT91_10810 [Candidatus Atribacteria bacterium HGW-Atribacteria-1]|nr:MAG: hypothetical protein CVT91_10810 [Candidatus Atribacteria bacterium HGW-Atribacteria-1]